MSAIEQLKKNNQQRIEKLANSKPEWIKYFKEVYIQNIEDKKPKKQDAFHKIGERLPKKIIIEFKL